jgi:hypothetical protein
MSFTKLTFLLVAISCALPSPAHAAQKAPRKKDVVVELKGRLSRGDVRQDPNIRTPPARNRVDAPLPPSK